jgi:formylglycine-generating enzyme required for sulfatase activity
MYSVTISQLILRLLNVATSSRLFLIVLVVGRISSVNQMNGNEMSYIPAGSYLMGTDTHLPDERPAHFVYVSALYCDKYEVSISFWEEIALWAEEHGYEFDSRVKTAKRGSSWSPAPVEHPMNMVTWFDAVKWSNARSEKEGRTPVYYQNKERTKVYRKGESRVLNNQVNWLASGFRLPTEAEWEKVARGGLVAFKYPWGDLIDGSKSNYRLSGDPFDNGSTPVGYFDGRQVIAQRDNSFGGEGFLPLDMVNGFGLYDVLGNVNEWCWDWYDPDWYGNPDTKTVHSLALVPDNRGPSTVPTEELVGGTRVIRGGSYQQDDDSGRGNPLRLAYRHQRKPDSALRNLGFRCLRLDIQEHLWANALPFGATDDKWMKLNWLGTFYQSDYKWIFHSELGWVYPEGEGSYDNWLFLPELGWLWTNGGIFPYFYSPAGQGTWIWYDLNRSHKGWFYNFRLEAWMYSGRRD